MTKDTLDLPAFSEDFSTALMMVLQGESADLIAALQLSDPAERRAAVAEILAQAQADPKLASQIQKTANFFQDQLSDPTQREKIFNQFAPANKSRLFASMDNVRDRRQVLRWIANDYETSNDHIATLLSTALQDPDWELRITAALVAARLHAENLVPLIAALDLPSSGREGLDGIDRQILRALVQAALSLLKGAMPPVDPLTTPATRDAMQGHLLRCVAGLSTQWLTRPFLWVQALTQPIPLFAPPAADDLPAGISVREGAYYLEQTGLELLWIPPLKHWLGLDIEPALLGKWCGKPHPIRELELEQGFFVSRNPLAPEWVERIIDDALSVDAYTGEPYCACTFEVAEPLLADLSAKLGLPLALPRADMWEMTARGPDGRRFPWGNSLDNDPAYLDSPWGASDMLGIVGQWVLDEDGPAVCGAPDQPHSALRRVAAAGERFALRPVIRIT